ncbi:MAG: hypothetical protein OH340_02765, partial [Candidatus Parvarchaeota archaeon]|nr:hypothetical protein [Candidatus Rehaiarchaeum fermentans]
LNSELRAWYGTIKYNEPEKKGLLADPNKWNDANYIKEIIDRIDKFMIDYFANAGKKDRNNLQVGEKSNNS